MEALEKMRDALELLGLRGSALMKLMEEGKSEINSRKNMQVFTRLAKMKDITARVLVLLLNKMIISRYESAKSAYDTGNLRLKDIKNAENEIKVSTNDKPLELQTVYYQDFLTENRLNFHTSGLLVDEVYSGGVFPCFTDEGQDTEEIMVLSSKLIAPLSLAKIPPPTEPVAATQDLVAQDEDAEDFDLDAYIEEVVSAPNAGLSSSPSDQQLEESDQTAATVAKDDDEEEVEETVDVTPSREEDMATPTPKKTLTKKAKRRAPCCEMSDEWKEFVDGKVFD